MRVFVAGGAGYVGSRLVPELLKKGYEVVVYDLYLYDQHLFEDLKNNPKLIQYKADLRDFKTVELALKGCDAVIHLACISNDPSFELNPQLGKSINLDAFEPFVQLAKKQKIQRFIYASSSSVYGVKEEENVHEEMSLEPLTDYSRFKAECEKILLRYNSADFVCTILRPATVCGYAPRQRLDVIVNILTNLAYNTGVIKVLGGAQMRPNLHIEDMVLAYIHVLESPISLVQGQIFNVGCHNHTVMALGQMVQKIVSKTRPVELKIESTNDHRSYHVSSEKIWRELGFKPRHTIESAVEDLICAFQEGKLPNSLTDARYFNIQTMKKVNLQPHVLITGGAGFIGSHLVDHLLAKGHRVTVLDNLTTGWHKNLTAAQTSPLFQFHEVDIRNRECLDPYFQGVDWVFHLAALADIVPSIEAPRAYFETNVNGTYNVLEASLKANVKRFVYAASSSCYGIPSVYPTPEEAPLSPQYPYALTKMLGEQLVMHWAQVYRLPALSLRMFNVYGPRSRTTGTYGAVFGVFLAQKLHGKPFTVVGDGTQTRDFTYVSDVVDAFYAAANSSLQGEIFNVGSGGHYSVNHLIDLLGGPSISIPKRPGEPQCTFADVTKIREKLGWSAKISFEEGVSQLLSQIDTFQEAPLWEPASIHKATEKWFEYLGARV